MYVWPTMTLDPPVDFERADIVFEGVDQAGPSFEARVFLNNTNARETTAPTTANGYAGAFHVYGYGHAARAPDAPASLPITKHVVATDAIRLALQHSNQLVVGVVTLPAATSVSFTRVTVVFDPS
jgi:hypothetical protein